MKKSRFTEAQIMAVLRQAVSPSLSFAGSTASAVPAYIYGLFPLCKLDVGAV